MRLCVCCVLSLIALVAALQECPITRTENILRLVLAFQVPWIYYYPAIPQRHLRAALKGTECTLMEGEVRICGVALNDARTHTHAHTNFLSMSVTHSLTLHTPTLAHSHTRLRANPSQVPLILFDHGYFGVSSDCILVTTHCVRAADKGAPLSADC